MKILFYVFITIIFGGVAASAKSSCDITPNEEEKKGFVAIVGEGQYSYSECSLARKKAISLAINRCIEKGGENCAVDEEFKYSTCSSVCEYNSKSMLSGTFTCSTTAQGTAYRSIFPTPEQSKATRCSFLTRCLTELATATDVSPEQYQKHLLLFNSVCK